MTLDDVLVVLTGLNILLCLVILARLGKLQSELTKLRRKRIYQQPVKKGTKP